MLNVQEVKTSKDEMKKRFSSNDYEKIENKLLEVFGGKVLTDHRGYKHKIRNYKDIENFFGLPYTDTSSFAGLWNTNTIYNVEGYNIDGFTLGIDNNLYIWTSNDNEEEKVFTI